MIKAASITGSRFVVEPSGIVSKNWSAHDNDVFIKMRVILRFYEPVLES